MSVDLPPPQAPQVADLAQLKSGGNAALSASILGKPLHVSGAPIDAARLAAALDGARTLPEAMSRLTKACYDAGFPAARVLYAEDAQDIYALVLPGRISAVHAPTHLQPYFEDLVGVDPLTDHQFEKARVMASMHADRAGIDSVPHFVPDGNGGSVLELNDDRSSTPAVAGLGFSDYGNRFAGRYLANAKGAVGDPWGDEFSFSWLEGLTSLDDDATASHYHAPQVGWTRVTTLGEFGAQARYVRYDYTQRSLGALGRVDATPVTGEVLVPQVSWLVLPLADFDRRWSVQALVDHTDNRLKYEDTDRPAEYRESYFTAEVDSSYFRQFDLMGFGSRVESALNLRQGIGAHDSGQYLPNLRYFLGRPTINLRIDWNDAFTSHLSATGQFTSDRLPEQEQFVLGGVDNLTAWLPGVGVGDNGYMAIADTVYRFEMLGQALKPRVFVEYGETSFRHPFSVTIDPPPGTGGSSATYTQPGRQSLADAGVELGMTLLKHLDIALSGAWGFHDSGISQSLLNDDETHLLFSLKLQF